ncbi:MAG: esterase/lipase family protein [Candidatus Binataceae bacterium]
MKRLRGHELWLDFTSSRRQDEFWAEVGRMTRRNGLAPWRWSGRDGVGSTAHLVSDSLQQFANLAALALRPATEFTLLMYDPFYWGWGVPRGDGHSVMVLPGLFAGDPYLIPLRSWLARVGYKPLRSGIDVNPGWSEALIEELCDAIEDEYARCGAPLTLIGHSAGGLLARWVASRNPRAVRHVITLGSPLAVAGEQLNENIRTTAIFTRDDLIVRHPAAVAREPHARNIEVRGSHSGLAFNPQVYRHLAELLREGSRSEAAERFATARSIAD